MVCPDPLTSVLDLRQCKEMADLIYPHALLFLFLFTCWMVLADDK